MVRSTGFRLALALVFLIAVNGLSGWLAVSFNYPSLWGSQEIFSEYAYPLPYGWALAHWLSMAPLAMLIAGLPMWGETALIRARWISLAVVVGCFCLETSFGMGRLEKTPFVLFIFVDAAVFLIISLAFKPPWRVLAVAVVVSVLIWGLILYLLNRDTRPVPDSKSAKQTQAEEPQPESLPFIQQSDLILDRHRKKARYYLEVTPVLTPGQSPTVDEICRAGEVAFHEMRRAEPAPTGFSLQVVFMVHPHFESEYKYAWVAGGASFTEGEWLCQFKYPEPRGESADPG